MYMATAVRIKNSHYANAGDKAEVLYRDGRYYPAIILETPGIN